MNVRMFLCGLALALLLGGAGLWLQEDSSRLAAERQQATNTAIPPPRTLEPSGTQVHAAESSTRAPADSDPSGSTPTAVLAMLELNAIVDAASTATTTGGFQATLDTLLGAKYAQRDRAQREQSLRAIRAALQAAAPSAGGKPAQALSAESQRALQLEADWLKEHLDG